MKQNYLRKLLVKALSISATPEHSVEEQLETLAVSLCPNASCVKDDVKHVLNLMSAVDILLQRYAA